MEYNNREDSRRYRDDQNRLGFYNREERVHDDDLTGNPLPEPAYPKEPFWEDTYAPDATAVTTAPPPAHRWQDFKNRVRSLFFRDKPPPPFDPEVDADVSPRRSA